MVYNQTVHYREHYDGSGQVVEVGTEQETAQGEHPDGAPCPFRAAEFRHEVEASVVCQHVCDGHCCEQIHGDARELCHVACEDVLAYKLVDGFDAVVLAGKEFLESGIVECLNVVRSYADIQHPSPHAAEDGYGGFVDAGDVFGADEQVAEQHQADNGYGHVLSVKSYR